MLLQSIATSCPNLHKELKDLGVKRWSRAYCPRRRYSVMTTNIAESVNKAILSARRLPITAAHEFLRHLVQRWFCARSEASNRLESSITRAAVTYINEMSATVEKCVVYPIQNSVKYHIKNDKDGDGIINVEEMTCSCKRWDLDRLPCFHAVAYARFARVRVSDLCHKYYSKEFLQHAYAQPINPVPGKEAWEHSNMNVLPMIEKKQSGRPKEKRFRSPAEGRRPKKCARCKQTGHSRPRCPNPPPSSIGSTSGCRTEERSISGARRVMHCSRCGGSGHTVRKCQASASHVNETFELGSQVAAEEANDQVESINNNKETGS